MKLKETLILLLIFVLQLSLNAQEINVFELTTRSEGADNKAPYGFVSLSDIDRFSDRHDSLLLPEFKIDEAEGYEKFRYIEFGSEYRSHFLARTNLSETDHIFIYSYSKDIFVSIPVSSSKVVAWLSDYSNIGECPCPEYQYQIGFEIEHKFLTGFEGYNPNTLVFVGKKNPFVRNQLKPIVWQEMDSLELPANLFTKEVNFNFGKNDFEFDYGQAYKFESGTHHLFIQKLNKGNWQFGLRLLVTDSKTGDKIFEELYFAGESSSFVSLNSQWFGHLFKNEPAVIFGFQGHSFGCPPITFIHPDRKMIVINCDNRH